MAAFYRLSFHRGPWAGREIVTGLTTLRLGNDPSKSDVQIEDDALLPVEAVLRRTKEGGYTLEQLRQGARAQTSNDSIFLSTGDRFHIGKSEIEIMHASPRLVQIGGPSPGRLIPLTASALRAGRHRDNHLVVTNHAASTHHATISSTALGFLIEDLESKNGTFINEEQVRSALLADSDSIRIGTEIFTFLVNERLPEDGAQFSPVRMQAHLLLLTGPQRGKKIPVNDSSTVVGSASECDFHLQGADVAPQQCRVSISDGCFYIEDLSGQTPGSMQTRLNRVAVEQRSVLAPGDLLKLGASRAQFHIGGGRSTKAWTVPDRSAAEKAKFIVEGRVEETNSFVIGSSPASQLHIDGAGIAPTHCRILWDAGFYLEDCSISGTYLGDTRIVRQPLHGEEVIRVGHELIDISVHGDCCTLERIDTRVAMQSLHGARSSEFNLGQTRAALKAPKKSGFQRVYQTAYTLAQPESEVAEPVPDKNLDRAPAWRPSTDITRPPTIKIAVLLAVITSLVFAFVAFHRGDAGMLLNNHPLSESHASLRFSTQAEELSIPSDCRACHSSSKGAADKLCLKCHEAFRNTVRPGHEKTAASVDGRTPPGTSCSTCHREHTAMPRLVQGRPSLLDANRGCVIAQCHPNQHEGRFDLPQEPGPNFIKAGIITRFNLESDEFHARHSCIEQDGEMIGVQCTTCHAEVSKVDGALVAQDPASACFGCHQPGGSQYKTHCLNCHGYEHGNAHDFVRLPWNSPEMVASQRPLPNFESLKSGAFVLFLISLPLLLYLTLLRLMRRTADTKVVERLSAFPLETVKHLVHSINLAKCVGCNACVRACPTDVLELIDHKSQIVNFDACIQCRACETSCSFDALVMHDADKPAPSTQTPDLDRGAQTHVKGLYLIGQASGLPQIKNASNMGRSTIEAAVKAGLQPGEAERRGCEFDVIIVGSGPAGLSAALTCRQFGLSALVLEKESGFAWTIRNYYHRGKPVMAEPHETDLIGYLPVWDTDREALLKTWQDTISSKEIDIRYKRHVKDIKKVSDSFEVTCLNSLTDTTEQVTAARVVIAIGGMGEPRKLGCPGDDLDKVHSALVDPDQFTGHDILVVGGTDSAIEVALALSVNNTVTLSCRGEKIERAKQANRDKLQEAFDAGKVIPRFSTIVVAVDDETVRLENRKDGSQDELANSHIFALIGGIPQTKWLQSLGVEYVARSHSWSAPDSDQLFWRE